MVRLKPYPKYKDSGLPWLGRIPAHWEMRRSKYLLREVNARSTEGNEQLLSVSQYTGVRPCQAYGERDRELTRAESLAGYKLVAQDDLVVNIMLAWNGSLGVAPSNGIVSPAYCVYRFHLGLHPRYYHHLFRTPHYKGHIRAASTGVVESRLRLYSDDLFRIESLVPTKDEQIAIARFVDVLNKYVDRFIRTKRRLIELLNEQKQAIIQRAVTRGLDPNVHLRPSGIDWLGDVPELWSIQALRNLGRKFGSGITPRGGAAVYQSSGVPLLRSQNVHFAELQLDEVAFISEEVHADMAGSHVKPGDVLINITGASIGRVCTVPEEFGEANVNQHVCIIRPNRAKVSPRFLAHFLSTQFIQDTIRVNQNGASREGLSLRELKALPILIPSPKEQELAEKAIECDTAAIRTIERATIREIDLICEYRTRLIADVVTGKLDVRGVELPPALDQPHDLEEWGHDEDAGAEELGDIEGEEASDADD